MGNGPPPPLATQGPNHVPPANRPGNNNYAQKSDFLGNGINISESYERNSFQEKSKRPEMKGPSDLTDILSGLKTKTINIQEPTITQQNTTANSSTISLDDLKELQGEGNLPKRSRRKKSNSNTISLDI
jgi:hypothetical protein